MISMLAAMANQLTPQIDKKQDILAFDAAKKAVEAAILQHCAHDKLLQYLSMCTRRGKTPGPDLARDPPPNRTAKTIYKIVPNSMNLANGTNLEPTNALNQKVREDDRYKDEPYEALELESDDLVIQSVICRWLEGGDAAVKESRVQKLRLMVRRLPVMLENILGKDGLSGLDERNLKVYAGTEYEETPVDDYKRAAKGG